MRRRNWVGRSFPSARLRPEQIVGGVIQAGSLSTIDGDSPILIRLARSIGERDFVSSYGDTGEDEFNAVCGTIPQRLLMMNGELVQRENQGLTSTPRTDRLPSSRSDRSGRRSRVSNSVDQATRPRRSRLVSRPGSRAPAAMNAANA